MAVVACAVGVTAMSAESERGDTATDVVFTNRMHGFEVWSTRLKIEGKAVQELSLKEEDFARFGDTVVITRPDESSPNHLNVSIFKDGERVARCLAGMYSNAPGAKRVASRRISHAFHELGRDGGEYDIGDICFHRTYEGWDTAMVHRLPKVKVVFVRNNVVGEVSGPRPVAEVARQLDRLITASLVEGDVTGEETLAETFDVLRTSLDDAQEWADLVKVPGKTAGEVRFTVDELSRFGAVVVSWRGGRATGVKIVDSGGQTRAGIEVAVFDTSEQAKRWLLSRHMLSSVWLSRAAEGGVAEIGDVSFYGTYIEGEGNPRRENRRVHIVLFVRNNVGARIFEAGPEVEVARYVDERILESLGERKDAEPSMLPKGAGR
jgi:hypothetical protein